MRSHPFVDPGIPPWINIEDKESRMDRQSKREVAAELEVEITDPTTLEFQIAVAPHPNTDRKSVV